VASDAVKAYVRGVFDNLGGAGPEARLLLREFLILALAYHRDVLVPAKNFESYQETRAWFLQPRVVEAGDNVKAQLTQLKAHGINLLGYTPADVCDAIAELYGKKPRRP